VDLRSARYSLCKIDLNLFCNYSKSNYITIVLANLKLIWLPINVYQEGGVAQTSPNQDRASPTTAAAQNEVHHRF
jgi:hypothetical protein